MDYFEDITSHMDDSVQWIAPDTYQADVEDTRPSHEEDYGYIVVANNKVMRRQDLPEYTDFLYRQNKNKNQAIVKHFEQLFDSATFLSSWEEDGIDRPTRQCREKTLALASDIFKNHYCMPVRIAPSVEEGIMIVYVDEDKDRSLKIEVYNSLKMAGLINQSRSIKLCVDLVTNSDINRLVRTFKE